MLFRLDGSGGPAPDDREPEGRPGGRGLDLRRLLPAGALLAGLVAFFAFDLDRFVTLEALKEHRALLRLWVADLGGAAWLVYGLVYAAAVALSIPGGTVLTITAGFLFGPYAATCVVVVAATCGAVLLFLVARYAFAIISAPEPATPCSAWKPGSLATP